MEFTSFTITLYNGGDLTDEMINKLEEISLYDSGSSRKEIHIYAKWDTHDIDMHKFSKYFPNDVFSVFAVPDYGNEWVRYWKNGNFQLSNQSIIYDQFDENELIEWN